MELRQSIVCMYPQKLPAPTHMCQYTHHSYISSCNRLQRCWIRCPNLVSQSSQHKIRCSTKSHAASYHWLFASHPNCAIADYDRHRTTKPAQRTALIQTGMPSHFQQSTPPLRLHLKTCRDSAVSVWGRDTLPAPCCHPTSLRVWHQKA